MADSRDRDQSERTRTEVPPDQLAVNPIQAGRLASLAGRPAKELIGTKYGELADRLKWALDPSLFLFRQVCGRVVKKDPATGTEYPVPNATVYVEDTDCGLLAYYPPGSKYGWFYPLGCRRETLATVKTDECGNFCVWVPRWDIDWILRWRKERFCFPVIFERPSIFDLLHDIPLLVDDRFPPRPVPGPDPAPDVDPRVIVDRISRMASADLSNAVGPVLGERLNGLPGSTAFGASTLRSRSLLSENAFPGVIPPPLPDELKQVEFSADAKRRAAHTMEMARGTIAHRLGVEVERLKNLDLRFPIGPFKRCVTRYIPEWSLVVDVPDITFRVTQDVDGDGTEELIYGESYFDVRWDAGTIPAVKLVASGLARESKVCEHPPVVCGNVPDIQFGGMMPLKAPYHNNTSGYGLRPNRPRPIPAPATPPDATAPFCLNVNLFGCLITSGGATKYRLVYRYSGDGGTTFSAELPFTNVDWWWHPLVGAPVHAIPDAAGWYDLPPGGIVGPEVNFLFPFNTGGYADGLYEVKVQVGTGGSSVLAQSSGKRLRVDNSVPSYTPSILWRVQGTSTWNPLTYPCPLVSRGAVPQAIEFDVKWEVSAAHYRDASMSAGDCGSGTFGAPAIQGDSTASGAGGTADWHQGELDNAVVFHARYVLPPAALQGTYNFSMHANTRAFNPSGADVNYLTMDWLYDAPLGGRYVSPSFYFSVVNA